MSSGDDFLRAQISNATGQYRIFLEIADGHCRAAEDPRFIDLCSRHIPKMREYQKKIEAYEEGLGIERREEKEEAVALFGVALDIAETETEGDLAKISGDLARARQAEDACKVFRDAGKMLWDKELALAGEAGESVIGSYIQEAQRLAGQMFAEHVQSSITGTWIVPDRGVALEDLRV